MEPDKTNFNERLNLNISKLNSFIQASGEAKGKGKIGVQEGRFFSSTFLASNNSKPTRVFMGQAEELYRGWKGYTSAKVFDELEVIAKDVATLLQDAEGINDPANSAKSEELRNLIEQVRNVGLKNLKDFFQSTHIRRDAKVEGYLKRCETLDTIFDLNHLNLMNVTLKEISSHTEKLSDNSKTESRKKIKELVKEELEFFNSPHKSAIKKISLEGGLEWKMYLAEISKLVKKWPEEASCLKGALLELLEIEGSASFDDDYFRNMLQNPNPENMRQLSIQMAFEIVNYTQLFSELSRPELDIDVVSDVVRDMVVFDLDLDALDGNRNTLIDYAIRNQNLKLCEQLLDLQVRVDIPSFKVNEDIVISPLELALMGKVTSELTPNQQIIVSMIIDSFVNHMAEKRNTSIDMSLDPTKLSASFNSHVKTEKRSKILEKAEKLTLGGIEAFGGKASSLVLSTVKTNVELNKFKENIDRINLEIAKRLEKLNDPELTSGVIAQLKAEIDELKETKAKIEEAAKINKQKQYANIAGKGTSALFKLAKNSNITKFSPAVDVFTSGVTVFKNVSSMKLEQRKIEMTDAIIQSLEEDIEVMKQQREIFFKLGMVFCGQLLLFKIYETSKKLEFIQNKRKAFKNKEVGKTVATTGKIASTATQIAMAASLTIPGLQYVAIGATLLSKADTITQGIQWVSGIGDLKGKDFEPQEGNEPLSDKSKERIAKRLGVEKKSVNLLLKNLARLYRDQTNFIPGPEQEIIKELTKLDVKFFEDLCRSSKILDEGEMFDQEKLEEYIARFLVA